MNSKNCIVFRRIAGRTCDEYLTKVNPVEFSTCVDLAKKMTRIQANNFCWKFNHRSPKSSYSTESYGYIEIAPRR